MLNSEIRQLVIQAAERESLAGAREIGGNNLGYFVEKYLNANHPNRISHQGEPWCVGFVLWCWKQATAAAGLHDAVTFTLSSGTLWERLGDRAVRLDGPETEGPRQVPADLLPGDVVFWDFSGNGKPDHVNLLHHLDQGLLFTIGGNEGNEASGAPVLIKNRGMLPEIKYLFGFGRMLPTD